MILSVHFFVRATCPYEHNHYTLQPTQRSHAHPSLSHPLILIAHVNSNGIQSRSLSAVVALIDEVGPRFAVHKSWKVYWSSSCSTSPNVLNSRTPSALQDLTELRCRRLGHSDLHQASRRT